MRFLLTLILVAWAMPAGAQISAGPTGGLALVDDNGKLIGGFHGAENPLNAAVTLSTPPGSGILGLVGFAGRTFAGFLPSSSFFTTADCTGQAYGAQGFYPPLNGNLLHLGLDQTLYTSSEPECLLIGRRENAA